MYTYIAFSSQRTAQQQRLAAVLDDTTRYILISYAHAGVGRQPAMTTHTRAHGAIALPAGGNRGQRHRVFAIKIPNLTHTHTRTHKTRTYNNKETRTHKCGVRRVT